MANITATIGATTSAGPKQVSVSIPSASSSNQFRSLSDVNSTTLQDGALIQYDSATDKFITKTTIDTESGSLRLSGGSF